LLEERKDVKQLLLVIIATVVGSGVCGTGFAQESLRGPMLATPGEYGIRRERLAFASRAASAYG
jgi:hypothetical protein